MPAKSENTFTPIPGAIYEVIVSKFGSAEDDWVRGFRIAAEEYPDTNFELYAKRGAVRRVDPAYLAEQALLPAPTADPNVVQLAQPHREFGGGELPNMTEDPVV